jgi:hypothetical protein
VAYVNQPKEKEHFQITNCLVPYLLDPEGCVQERTDKISTRKAMENRSKLWYIGPY